MRQFLKRGSSATVYPSLLQMIQLCSLGGRLQEPEKSKPERRTDAVRALLVKQGRGRARPGSCVLYRDYWVTLGSYWGYIGAILGLYWGSIGVLLGLYWGYMEIMDKKMETTIISIVIII